ncbi:sce7726 family protein [Crystallibacter degradans]|uniref:sce7726 family protein n=1 Tax=Crystallibacter degradans TaxID=2726743 RepID=UPI001473DA5F|nr:sce7726 family protein [Arthrobacter sp. SF27]NMR28644.1 sce7726 family protein [Arthrobacter sp. SF27]
MRDIEIRSALIDQLRSEHPDPVDNRVWSELSLCLGASRVDVCLINGALTGFEIKSPRDNLTRLPSQIEHYNLVLDFASIVSTEKHANKAMGAVPEWWGVMCATQDADSRVRLHWEREPQHNPKIDPLAVAQLLWRDEAFEELSERGLHKGLSKATRWVLWDRLVEMLPLDELQAAVRARLKARPSRTTDEIHRPCGVK